MRSRRFLAFCFGVVGLRAILEGQEIPPSLARRPKLPAALPTPTPVPGCPVRRGVVKTGTDPDAGLVNLSASAATTIGEMVSWATPSITPPRNRISPYETTVWVVDATLTRFKLEDDSDYHLILSDLSGRTLIAELTSPDCAPGSRFLPQITSARSEFRQRFTPSVNAVTTSIPVRVTGIGMFDDLEGRTGAAPNGIEIHPVLDISFETASRPDFSIAVEPWTVLEIGGRSTNVPVTTTTLAGFNAPISVSLSSLPAGVTGTVQQPVIGAPGAGTTLITLVAGPSVVAGSYSVTVTGLGSGVSHAAILGLEVPSGRALIEPPAPRPRPRMREPRG